ncbi:hypothetical protein [Adhaeribacter arboris]|nr:hypothetical protein [Adhaeribacter arboris]
MKIFFHLFTIANQFLSFAQSAERIRFTSIIYAEETSQDYSP